MRIGSADNFLLLEKAVPHEPASAWRLEAQSTGPDCRFTTFHQQVQIDACEESRNLIRDFLASSLYRVEIGFSQGGWLRLKRDLSGHILVRYRVNCLRVGAAMEGEIVVEGPAVGMLGEELKTLFD